MLVCNILTMLKQYWVPSVMLQVLSYLLFGIISVQTENITETSNGECDLYLNHRQ